ncbi:hypothetical protein HK100_005676, partial [Physocladia obscura]
MIFFDKLDIEYLGCLGNLANLKTSLVQYEEAEKLILLSLDRMRECGFNAAAVYAEQNNFVEANAVLLKSIDGFTQLLGSLYPWSLKAYTDLAMILLDMGNYAE